MEENILEIKEEELTPEIRRFLDQERTRASKTARENAMRDAVKDVNVINTIKAQLEEEAKKSAEEKLVERERQLAEKENRMEAKTLLINAGVSDDILNDLLELSLGSDIETTKERTQKLINSLSNVKTKTEEAYKAEKLKNLTPPGSGGNDKPKSFSEMSETERLELKKNDPERFKKEISNLRRI